MKRIVLITSMLVMILTTAFSNDSMAQGCGRGYAQGYVYVPRPRVVVTIGGGGYGNYWGHRPYYRHARGYDRRYDNCDRGGYDRRDYNRGGYDRGYNNGGDYNRGDYNRGNNSGGDYNRGNNNRGGDNGNDDRYYGRR